MKGSKVHVDVSPSVFLTRRQTLWAMAGVATLGLAGCGGGGHGNSVKGVSSSTSLTTTALPSGFTLPTAQLKGETAFGSASVGANGSFAAKVRSGGGPTFAWLRHTTTGKYVLFGFAGPGQSGVSAMGSATAILALAFGVGGLSPADASSLVSLIEASAATATLAGVIEARVVADPYALTDGDSQVQVAVQAAVASLGGATPSIAKSVTRANPADLLTVQPQDQSGCSVEQGTAAASIVPTNKARRPAAAYTYQTGYTTADGTTTTFPTAQAFGSEEDLAPTIGFLASLATLGVRPANAPVTATPLTLPLHSGSTVTKTTYETVILMASESQAAEPAFFADAKYAGVVDSWRTKRQELNKHAWIGTILRDTFASVVGGASSWISLSAATAAVARIEAVGGAAAQAVIDVESGKFLQGTYTWLSQAVAEGDIATQTRKAIADIVFEAEGASEAAVGAEVLTAIGGIAALVIGTLAVAGSIIGVADLGVGWTDLATSDLADVWSISLLKPNVVISPATGTVSPGGTLALTAATPGTSETLYKYHWTLSSGGNGNIGDPTGAVSPGRDITTTGTSVNLATAASDVAGTIYTVTVAAIELTTGDTLGTAKATLTVGKFDTTEGGSFFTTSGPNPEDSVSGAGVAYAYVRFNPVAGATTYTLVVDDPNWPFKEQARFTYASLLPTTTLDGTSVGNAILVQLDQTRPAGPDQDGLFTTPQAIADLTQQFSGFNYRVEAT